MPRGYSAGMPERFIRLEQLLGKNALDRLSAARVAVFGLGAVGTYALEALTRSGVGEFILVDFDVVRPSNFNRQLLALEGNLGKYKVALAGERVLQIDPQAKVTAYGEFAAQENFARFLTPAPDIVIDAIDSVNPKAQLIAYCLQSRLPFISAMGAGMRLDPLAVRVGDLGDIHSCSLARAV